MPLSFWLVIALGLGLCLTAAAHSVFALSNSAGQLSPLHAAALMAVTFLAIVLELRPTRLHVGREIIEVTLTSALALPLLLLAGWPYAVAVHMFATAASDLQVRKAWYKVLYNAGNLGWSLWLAGNLYTFLTSGRAFNEGMPTTLAASVLAGLVFTASNTFLVALPVAAVQGLPYRAVFVPYFRAVSPFFAGVTSLSVAIASLWHIHPLAATLLLPGLITTKLAYENYVRLREETDNFLHALADAVDLRDPYTACHSARVSELCRALGERLALQGEALWRLQAIARVHDVGKIVVPDSLLLKSGTLTPQEHDQIKGHVEAGVRILEHVSLYRDSLEILAQHHERLDGSGYPRGLRGDEIILPARILAVADAYDAMTTDRPYRRARTPEDAVRELYRLAGKEYDLNVVRALEDELIARGILKEPVVPAALEATRQEAEAEAHAAARTARVVRLPRVDSGRKSP